MSGPVRLAGRGRTADGSVVTWSVADGAKGRRWREVLVRDAAIAHSLLLETFPDRSFAHLELSTSAGLLTLHPEGDGTLHGNAVTALGVAHVRGIPWPAGSVVCLDRSPIASAAAARGVDDGRTAREVPAVRILGDLSLRSLVVPAGAFAAVADADGLPILDAAATWPLELRPGDGR